MSDAPSLGAMATSDPHGCGNGAERVSHPASCRQHSAIGGAIWVLRHATWCAVGRKVPGSRLAGPFGTQRSPVQIRPTRPGQGAIAPASEAPPPSLSAQRQGVRLRVRGFRRQRHDRRRHSHGARIGRPRLGVKCGTIHPSTCWSISRRLPAPPRRPSSEVEPSGSIQQARRRCRPCGVSWLPMSVRPATRTAAVVLADPSTLPAPNADAIGVLVAQATAGCPPGDRTRSSSQCT
jgi:hypothetical protein